MEKVIIIASLLLCGCGVPGLTSEDIYGLTGSPKVWLYGLVTNARSGAPLSDVSIQIEGRSTSSDGRGAYRIDDLPVGPVFGSASVHGFKPYALSLRLRAGANPQDVSLVPQECGRFTCAADEFCDTTSDTCVTGATLTGSVINACDRTALDARITINGKATCSSAVQGKPYWELHGLQPGGPQTLSAGKTGYQAFVTHVTLTSGFNAVDVELTPVGGCSAGTPANVPCSCTESFCQ